MLNFYPDDYYYNDTDRFYQHDPRSARQQQQLRRAQLQRQAAVEEEEQRQRAMLYERSMRMRREEEDLRRREAEMRRREEMLMAQRRRSIGVERKRREEELARRQRALEQNRRDDAAEKPRRRILLERQWQQERQRELELERRLEVERAEEEEERRRRLRDRREKEKQALRGAEYGIVRGVDGRLYKLNADDRFGAGYDTGGRMGPVMMPLSAARNDNEPFPMMSTSEESGDSDAEDSGVVVMEGMEAPETTNASFAKKERKNIRKKTDSIAQKVKKVKASAVLIGDVEDASDSEQEDLSSIWRNRRPAEGEWMEPVEGYDVYW